MSTTAEILSTPTQTQDFLPILGTDYIEFYVGNAKQAAYFYQHAFGFQPVAYRGLETGHREAASYVLRQGKVTLVLTTPYHPGNFIADHIYRHGDGVRVLALTVEDATKAFEETTKRGGRPFLTPTRLSDENGEVV
ncbi:MAG: 4-hydroxyphenylpyruvate dioxygenase, partial [Bacteroidetes bacterium]